MAGCDRVLASPCASKGRVEKSRNAFSHPLSCITYFSVSKSFYCSQNTLLLLPRSCWSRELEASPLLTSCPQSVVMLVSSLLHLKFLQGEENSYLRFAEDIWIFTVNLEKLEIKIREEPKYKERTVQPWNECWKPTDDQYSCRRDWRTKEGGRQ